MIPRGDLQPTEGRPQRGILVPQRAAFGTQAADPASPVRTELGKVFARSTKDGFERLSVQPITPLRPWLTALGNRENAAAKALFIGDSITEGKGATSETQTWANRLQYLLQSRFPTVGVTPTLTSRYQTIVHHAVSLPLNNGTITGSPTKQAFFAFGFHNYSMSGTQTWTITVTGTSADLLFGKSGSSGTLYYTVDGGAQTTVNTNQAGGTTTRASPASRSGRPARTPSWSAGRPAVRSTRPGS